MLLALLGAALVCAVAVVLAYGLRVSRSRGTAAAVRLATIGYGLPGSVVAVAVFVPLAWLDERLGALVFAGTVVGLLFAYLVRFLALAFQAAETSLARVPPSLDEAARGLGSDRLDVLARVHLPLMRTGLLTGALLVLTEVMKELPATMLLRPLGGDTLAVAVWQATSESLWETAALPALMIVLVGLLPVIMLIRLSGRQSVESEVIEDAPELDPRVEGTASPA
jgi:iron(III) transport system permease protein